MLQRSRIAVVVPAYNEAKLITATLRKIPHYVDDIVVVDDGSQDETYHRVKSLDDRRVKVIRHSENRGVGAAIITGYNHAFGVGADIAAVMAGDDQMAPEQLEQVLCPILQGKADYVIGNRLTHPEVRLRMPTMRWVGNHLFSTLTRWVTGLQIRDCQCGYTALSREGAQKLPLDRLWPRYGYLNDLLAHCALVRIRIEQVSVEPVYKDEVSGIRAHHVLITLPCILLRAFYRRLREQRGLRIPTLIQNR